MPTARQLSRSAAKVALAVLFAGPIGGAREAGNQMVDLFLVDKSGGTRIEPLLREVESGLAALAAGEGIPAAILERAMADTETIIGRYGLTADELTAAGLDPDRAVAIVIARAESSLADLDEAEEALCRRAVAQVYRTLVERLAGRPEMTTAYRREMLRRLDGLADLPELIRQAIATAQAHMLVADPAMRWHGDRFPSSALLRPEYRVVPFWGRDDMIDGILAWAAEGSDVSLRLYVGAGGMGKTRLMIEACGRLRLAGWRAGFLHESTATADQLAVLGRDARGVVVVVDYSETRPGAVSRLIDAALAATVPVRVLLLARSTADWWPRLRQLPDAVGDFLNGPAVGVHVVSALAGDAADRATVYRRARAAFRDTLGSDAPEPADPGDLDAQAYERVLFLLIRALAAVEGEDVEGGRGLLDYALRREQRFWDDGMRESDLAILAGRPVRQAAALATLAGNVHSFEQAINLVGTAPLLRDQPSAALGRVADLLHRLYPGESWLGGVQPDLLGEHLVARVIEEEPTLLAVLGGA